MYDHTDSIHFILPYTWLAGNSSRRVNYSNVANEKPVALSILYVATTCLCIKEPE